MRNSAPAAGRENRQATRIALESTCQVVVMRDGASVQMVGALTRDVSLSGISFLVPAPMWQGQKIVVRLPRKGTEVIHIRSLVRHCRSPVEGLYIIGAEFLSLASTDEVSQLRTHLADELHRIQQSILV